MAAAPLLFAAALFTSLWGIWRLYGELLPAKTSGAGTKKGKALLGTALLSLLLSLIFQSTLLFPLSLIALNVLILTAKRKRQARLTNTLNRELPFLALSLSLLIDAGCSIQSAVANMHECFPPGPSRIFLSDVRSLFEIGVDAEKLKGEMAGRYRSIQAELILESLITGKALGSGPGKSLKQLSEKIFSDRVAQAEERALKAPVKLMLPLCLFIFPAIFLLIFSPIILQIGGLFG